MELIRQTAVDEAFECCRAALEGLLHSNPDSEYSDLLVRVLTDAYATAVGAGSSGILPNSACIEAISDVDDLREIFERLVALKPCPDGGVAVDAALQKDSGAFYTPSYITHYIASQALEPLLTEASRETAEVASQGRVGDELLRPFLSIAVLDAAAGTGRFLTAAAHLISQSILSNHHIGKHLRLSQLDAFRLVAENCVHGVDIDAAALHITALLLGFETRADVRWVCKLKRNLRTGNAMKSVDLRAPRLLAYQDDELNWQEEFPHVFQRKRAGFDAVMGNPPWISFSGREARRIDQELRRYLYSRWESMKGWPSSHGVFLEIAAAVCRQGGMIGQIVPEQILDLSGYEQTRRAVFRHASQVGPPVKVDERAFDGVTSPACVVILQRTEPERTAVGQTLKSEATLTSNGLRKADDSERVLTRLIDRMNSFPPLPQDCFGDIGVHTGNCGKLLVSIQDRENLAPLRIGKDIYRYFASDPQRWLRVGMPAGEGQYFTIRPLERYVQARILLRQTATHPIAARHVDPTYFRNSVLAYYGSMEVSDDYILALLNSRLIRFFHQYQHRDARQRAFPQVKVRHLRSIPAPRLRISVESDQMNIAEIMRDRGFHSSVETLPDSDDARDIFEQLTSDGRLEYYLAPAFCALTPRMEELVAAKPCHEAAVEAVDWLIDQLVFRLYGVNEKEQEAIDRFFSGGNTNI